MPNTNPETPEQAPELFVTCVGRQPAATAVTIKTWAATYDTAQLQVLLLATPQTRPIAERLAKWIQKRITIASVSIKTVAPSFVDTDHPSPGTALKEFLSSTDAPEHVLCYADPGFKSMVLSLVYALNDRGAHYTRLHASINELHVFDVEDAEVECVETIGLKDIGVHDLLELYDLNIQRKTLKPDNASELGADIQQVIRRCRRRLPGVILDIPNSKVDWVVACEKRGRLYCLVNPRGRDRSGGFQTKAREVMNLRQTFRPLQAEFTALGGGAIAQHLRNEGIDSIHPNNTRNVRQWFEGRIRPPGSVTKPTKQLIKPPDNLGEHMGKLADGLIIQVLGLDPTANLISLATHAADGFDKVLFIYDPNLPELVQRATYVRNNLKKVGFNQARFVPASYLESMTNARIVERIDEDMPKKIRVDVTPGTKSQASDFVTAIADPARLWMIHGASGKAMSLDGKASLPLKGPDIKSWAKALSGPLNEGSGAMVRPSKFYSAVAELLPVYPIKRQESFQQWLSRVRESEKSKGPEMRRLWRSRKGTYCARSTSGRSKSISDSGETRKIGFLFEGLVAQCLRCVPHDEMRAGLEWSWDPIALEHFLRLREDARDDHRCELDLILRRGHRVLCISCKSTTASGAELAADVTEIEAVAANGFSRFAIPVLIRSYVNPQKKKASIEARRGTILLDQKDLAHPATLNELIDTAVSNRIPVF